MVTDHLQWALYRSIVSHFKRTAYMAPDANFISLAANTVRLRPQIRVLANSIPPTLGLRFFNFSYALVMNVCEAWSR